jgi:hypothetical protein
MVPVAVGSLLAADFTSGFVHCAADNFGTEDTPFFGVAFIRPFRDHHRDPMDITRHDFVETNGNSCLVNLLVLIPVYHVLAGRESDVLSLLVATAVLCFTGAIMMTNQIHKWAHMPEAPSYVRRLQRARLILTPTNHSMHHTVPFDTNYCITTGWMNGITERTHLFAWLVKTFR